MEKMTIFATDYAPVRTLDPRMVEMEAATMTQEEIKSSFDKLYKEQYNKVFVYIKSYVGSNLDAENILQDVFVSVWENYPRIEREYELAFLFKVAKNKSLNFLRGKKNFQRNSEGIYHEKVRELNSILLESDLHPEISQKEIEKIINNGLDSMKKRVRRTFLLSRIEGMKYSEIAEAEDVSVRAVEARISSALLTLRVLLKDYLR